MRRGCKARSDSVGAMSDSWDSVAERHRNQHQPRAGPRDLEPTSVVDDHYPAYVGFPAAPSPPPITAIDALDVGEQIRRLQALAELLAAGILTDVEVIDLKRRVLASGPDASLEVRCTATMLALNTGGGGSAEAAAAGNGHVPPADTQRAGPAATGASSAGAGATKEKNKISGAPGPVLNRRAPKGSYVTTLKVVGTKPITWRMGAKENRPLYVSWKNALDAAAAKAEAGARPTSSELFSLRIELRLYAPGGQGSDLDNYVKPIQDALAERGLFGPVAHKKGPMKGDERVDHLDIRRRRVSSEAEAGVLAEVWALDA